jgi:hypothetical protein
VRGRPVERVIERVRREDGAAWLDHALWRTTKIDPRVVHTFARDPHDLGLLRALKDMAHARRRRAITPEAAAEATAAYFLLAGAALAQHGVVIVGNRPRPLADVLADLGEAAPDPWRATLLRALSRC